MEVRFSKQAFKDIKNETKEIQESLLVLFDALSKGANLTMPVSRNIVNVPGLKELRVKDKKGIVRVFY